MPLCRVLLQSLVKGAASLSCWLAALSDHNGIMTRHAQAKRHGERWEWSGLGNLRVTPMLLVNVSIPEHTVHGIDRLWVLSGSCSRHTPASGNLRSRPTFISVYIPSPALLQALTLFCSRIVSDNPFVYTAVEHQYRGRDSQCVSSWSFREPIRSPGIHGRVVLSHQNARRQHKSHGEQESDHWHSNAELHPSSERGIPPSAP